MRNLIVLNNPKDWQLEIEGSEVVPARTYLTDPEFSSLRNARVFNLCRTYRYQSIGYYVSLLAAARGQKPMPSVSTILDFKNITLVRFVSDDLDDLIQKSLRHLASEDFTLSIYFGRNLAHRYDRLSVRLFKMFPAPFLRAHFRYRDGKWQMVNIDPISANEIRPEHLDFAIQMTRDYFSGRRVSLPKMVLPRYYMAVLYDPAEEDGPSDERAIQKFIKAAEELEIGTEIISRDDYGRLPEFDALFIRESTSVNHHTFRFSRRAQAEGLVVIDDPESILRCTNKVYLAELLSRYGVPMPKSLVVHSRNRNEVSQSLGLPCILKQPDSYFSFGVVKVGTDEEMQQALDKLFIKSDLVIAQEFTPTDFDWRIGVLDRKAFYACKYYMARNHWQIAKRTGPGQATYGKVEAVPLEMVPEHVVKNAVAAANLIGDGLYGVDVKEIGGKSLVIEVNDNPTFEAGREDAILKDELYREIMRFFLQRIEQLKGGQKKK
ncbi:MAG TPA: RimK family protein [Acidobacteriota bacterium]|nr:RimK family protein [Acidobacteriota bacterium]